MAAGETKPHAVCLPLPGQGHVTPTMSLARLLHGRGFHVTFVNTEHSQRRLLRSSSRGGAVLHDAQAGFRFATIPDGLPPASDDDDGARDPAAVCYSTMTTCLPHFRSLLADLDGDGTLPPVTCVVADNVMSFAVDAAREIGVPCAFLWTASACGYLGYRHYRSLVDHGLAPLNDDDQLTDGYLDTPVSWAPGMSDHMRLRDFPSFICRSTTDVRGGVFLNFLTHEVERTDTADAVILNTFDELERPALDAMRAMLVPPIYTVGPLNSLAEAAADEQGTTAARSASLWREDRACLEWLDGREPRSVVYVNYGSITTMSGQELAEFAWGLAGCGYDFLWVVRNDLVEGGGDAAVPAGFSEATEGRCLLASWCEQGAVLRHEAVGVFLTHCGWNSTVESLSAGVPMLCWPFFAEQQTNSRYSCAEWGVGMEVGGDVLRREVVAARIREAMGCGEMRRRAAEWKDAGVRATSRPGGSSVANLESLVEDVLLSRARGRRLTSFYS